MSRARQAEAERRSASQVYYEALVTEHDRGDLVAILRAKARLSLDSVPCGAHVIAQRYFERDRVLVPGEEQYFGVTPVKEATLEPGSYLVTLKREGFRDVRYPVLLARGTHHAGRVALYTDEEIGEGFVHVPAAPCIVRGDPEAYDSLPRQEVFVESFTIARFPVTMREYCAFLDALRTIDASAVPRRAPHDLRGSEGLVVQKNANGDWEPRELMLEGEARTKDP